MSYQPFLHKAIELMLEPEDLRDLLEMLADGLEAGEPYAVNAISAIRATADYAFDAMQGEIE